MKLNSIPDINLLRDMQILVEKLNNTNSSNEKVDILRQQTNPNIKRLLNYVYHPLKNFYVTSDHIKKFRNEHAHETMVEPETIFELLDVLSTRKYTGHKALIKVINYIDNDRSDYQDLIYNIIDRNLKCRIDVKLINRAFPGCIPEFRVALAKKYEDYANKIDLADGWYASRKLDGCRCLAFIDGDNIKYFSRQGKEFFTLSNLDIHFKGVFNKPMVLDGEVCLNNNFSDIMKEIRKKDHTISNPTYYVFDCLTMEEFENGKSNICLMDRLNRIKDTTLVNSNHTNVVDYLTSHMLNTTNTTCIMHNSEIANKINLLEQWHIYSMDVLNYYIDMADKNGWEGLILRKNTSYEAKRSSDLLKIKSFYDDEYYVTDVEFGNIRFIQDGREISEEMLSAVIINHKGFDVRVGSGFSIEQRREFYRHPDKIKNRIITVKYFEESSNQDKGLSLRFPTFKCLHGNTRNT